MSTTEIRNSIIEELANIDDELFLQAIKKTIIDTRKNAVYQFSDEEPNKLNEARMQYTSGHNLKTVKGIYEDGIIRLERKISARKHVKVIVTFLEDELQDGAKRLTVKDFSFLKSRKASERYKGSLSDAVIENRKEE